MAVTRSQTLEMRELEKIHIPVPIPHMFEFN